MINFDDVVENVEVKELMKNAQKQLDVLGYTEHSQRHWMLVAERATYVLKTLGYDAHRIELAKIAGYIHDIGNSVNRVDHAHSGAILRISHMCIEAEFPKKTETYLISMMKLILLSKRAAKYLGLWFELIINNTNLL